MGKISERRAIDAAISTHARLEALEAQVAALTAERKKAQPNFRNAPDYDDVVARLNNVRAEHRRARERGKPRD